MSTLIALPIACSVSTGAAALLWCRGLLPIIATTLAVGACVLVLA
ncbi:hypothetical protein [Methylobacterium sp. NMS14P]|nr:hypothetical protein [Methylobacterium sp. NMS14P]